MEKQYIGSQEHFEDEIKAHHDESIRIARELDKEADKAFAEYAFKQSCEAQESAPKPGL